MRRVFSVAFLNFTHFGDNKTFVSWRNILEKKWNRDLIKSLGYDTSFATVITLFFP